MDDFSRSQRLIALVVSAAIGVAYIAFLASRLALGKWAACSTLEATALYAGVLVLALILIGFINYLVHDMVGVVIDRLKKNPSPRYEDVFVDYDKHENVEKPVSRITKYVVVYPLTVMIIAIEPLVGLLAIDQLAGRFC